MTHTQRTQSSRMSRLLLLLCTALALLSTVDAFCTYHYKDAVYTGEKNERQLAHGKGSMEFPDGAKITGTFREGFPHGKAIQYFVDGSVFYDGSWNMGKRWGFGKLYYSPDSPRPLDLHYEGHFEHNFFHGEGIFHNLDGSVFTGTFNRGMQWNGVVTSDEEPPCKLLRGYPEL